jgi:hypothetical protein
MKKLVSAIYLNYNRTPKGGRPFLWKDRYINGIANLRNNSYQKIIYTDGDERILNQLNKTLSAKCSDDELKLFEIKTFDINKCKFSSQLDDLGPKENRDPLAQRCPHVQYAKIDFLYKESLSSEFAFWIDAGLISPNLFPKRLVPSAETEIITDKYLTSLESRIKDKLYFICGNRHRGFSGPSPNSYQYHPIGGFFGGSKIACDFLSSKYSSIAQSFLNEGTVLAEQGVMEEMLYENIRAEGDEIIFDIFESWYHEDHMVKQGAQAKNIKFYKVFCE